MRRVSVSFALLALFLSVSSLPAAPPEFDVAKGESYSGENVTITITKAVPVGPVLDRVFRIDITIKNTSDDKRVSGRTWERRFEEASLSAKDDGTAPKVVGFIGSDGLRTDAPAIGPGKSANAFINFAVPPSGFDALTLDIPGPKETVIRFKVPRKYPAK